MLLLARDPGLAVELARGGVPQVADRDVDDAVGEAQRAEDLLLDREQPLVLGLRLRRLDEAEHLDLVELVDAEDPARVAARGPGLAAEARGEARVAQRQIAGVDDLPGVQRRERHLARADEEQLVLGERVDLVLGVRQEAGAEERLLADEDGRDDRLEPVSAQQLEHPADERQLEEDEVPAQVGEARAREPRGLLHLDHPARELQVIARGGDGPRLAALVEDGVLRGRGRVGQVREPRERILQLGLDAGQLLREALRAARDLAHLRDRLVGRPALALRGGDRVVRGVLLAAQRLELRQDRAPALVQLEHAVQAAVVPAARERGADHRRVTAQQLQIEHERRRAFSCPQAAAGT